MKWHSETVRDWEIRLSKWHNYFAWHPVFFPEHRQTVWLETIERRLYSYNFEYGSTWEYRRKGDIK